ncbi:MAG: MFS transporter [Verrucomicrobia bacterium]|nr:MFS transporter [Verrucomicrobiota bacterium]MCH8528876.1 MFS transporter [Kiritimatiellia bacterium]
MDNVEQEAVPHQEHDWKILNRSRMRFGVATILYGGDEGAFSPFHTVIIRALGGGDAHLGFIGASAQVMAPMFTWIGAVILRWTKFNRKGMIMSLWAGALVQAGLIAALVMAARSSSAAAGLFLYVYLGLISCMLMVTGAQGSISASWIGDLVPTRFRGRFVSGMQIIGVSGGLAFQFIFSRLAVQATGLTAYAGLMGLLCLNTLFAIFVIRSVPERRSFAMKFLTTHKTERVNYRYSPLWHMVAFEFTWRGGRVALGAFTTAYLLDYFGMGLDRVILLNMVASGLTLLSLFIVGKLSDRIGNYLPLMVISAVCAVSMLLWVSTAWWGIWPIIAYQIINGAAGSTHWMLVNNLCLEAYPAIGRPNYLSLSKSISGLMLLISTTYAGHLLSLFRGWSTVLWGAEINHYHVFFLCCTLLTASCVIPLKMLGLFMASPKFVNTDEE